MAQPIDDWVKIRTGLGNDNRVLRMIWLLGDEKEGMLLEQVGLHNRADGITLPDALLRVTIIGGLSVVWGTVRHQGVPLPGGDCLLEGANEWAIDTITGLDGFGRAMAKVGWVHEEEEGLVFPDFFGDFNTIPRKGKLTDAEKSKRYRERQKAKRGAVTETVTALPTEKEKEKEIKKDSSTKSPKKKVFKPPTLDEVVAYCAERGKGVDAEQWHDFYSAKDWMIGKNKMKDWKAAVRTWEKNRGNGSGQTNGAGGGSGKTSAREHNQQVSDYLDSVIAEEHGKGAI